MLGQCHQLAEDYGDKGTREINKCWGDLFRKPKATAVVSNHIGTKFDIVFL